jgi:hypothetical protein
MLLSRHTRRRQFITLLAGGAAWPLAARAQQGGRVRRIGVLMVYDENDPVAKTLVSAFTQALADLGWADGGNVRIVPRWYGGDINRIRAFAKELVGLQPDIILANGTAAAVALQRETRTIPIVFATVADPVASGIVISAETPPSRTPSRMAKVRTSSVTREVSNASNQHSRASGNVCPWRSRRVAGPGERAGRHRL